MNNHNNQDDRYKDLEDEVYNILLDLEDADYFPLLYVDSHNQLTPRYDAYSYYISFQNAIDRFGVHTVGEACRINLANDKLNELLDELDYLEENFKLD